MAISWFSKESKTLKEIVQQLDILAAEKYRAAEAKRETVKVALKEAEELEAEANDLNKAVKRLSLGG